MSNQSTVIRRKTGKLVLASCLFFTAHCSLFTVHCLAAAERETTITSDTLEYFSDGRKYVAKGSVRIEQEDAVVLADEVVYFEETSDVTADGNVRYDDPRASFSARKAEMNMDKKTGRLFSTEVFLKEDNYRLTGAEIERRSEDEYFSREEVSLTTCDGLPAAWCFRGREAHLKVGDSLTAEAATFRIRDIPVLYSPYLFAPVSTERKTGFLMPTVSSSSRRGIGLNVPFYWVIAEEQDATFVLDMYTKKGIGTGIEYRLIGPHGLKSNWWVYHMYDRDLGRDFVEIRGLHDDRSSGGFGWFLDANFVNEKDYYREMNPHKEKKIQRFLQSTAEFNIPLDNLRFYLLAQYWVDLKDTDGDIPQRLPEIGLVLNYTRAGNFLVGGEANAMNLWRKNGTSIRAAEANPRILHTMGSDVVLSQRATVGLMAYETYKDAGLGSNRTSMAFEYDGKIHTRLFRKYDSFTHIIEPTIRYNYVHMFDDKMADANKSRLELSLLNRIIVAGKELLTARITQPIDVDGGDRPFRPLEFDVGIQKPLPAKIGATYNVHTGKVETVSSDIRVPFSVGAVTFGQRYNRKEDINVYKAGVEIQPVKPIQIGLKAWYDAKKKDYTNLEFNMGYSSQCWGVRLEASSGRSGDYSVQVMFDLFGITGKPPAIKE